MPGGVNHNSDSKNWLVFGAGAHRCIGKYLIAVSQFVLC